MTEKITFVRPGNGTLEVRLAGSWRLRDGFPDGVRRLIKLATAVPEKETHAGEIHRPLLARFGLAVMGFTAAKSP